MPRHPPCALVLLIRRTPVFRCRYGVFKVHASSPAIQKEPPTLVVGLSKLSSKTRYRGRHILGESICRTVRRPSNGNRRLPTCIAGFPRKEVIQPQLPLRLPCYDFTPIIDPTLDGSLPKRVRPPASGIADFRGVTGGVYKARERIHRDVADSRLLATPPSWRRVSASNPNRDRLFGIRSPSRVCSPLYRPM